MSRLVRGGAATTTVVGCVAGPDVDGTAMPGACVGARGLLFATQEGYHEAGVCLKTSIRTPRRSSARVASSRLRRAATSHPRNGIEEEDRLAQSRGHPARGGNGREPRTSGSRRHRVGSFAEVDVAVLLDMFVDLDLLACGHVILYGARMILTFALSVALQGLRLVTIDDLGDVPAVVASVIVSAVNQDPAPPLLGSYVAEARLMAVYARYESGYRVDAVGDHGRALGLWQLQGVGRGIGFDPLRSAETWLRLAHRSSEACSALPQARRLAQLTSGTCERGRVVAERRARLALAAE